MKKFLALLLAAMMLLSMAACDNTEGELAGDLNNDGQIEMGQDGVDVEEYVGVVANCAQKGCAQKNCADDGCKDVHFGDSFVAGLTDDHNLGTVVTLTANAATEGKVFSYWDGLQGLTLTEGNAVSGTLKFTMPSSDVTVKAVYRNVGEIKIGSIPTTKFTNKFTKNKALLTT